MAVTVNGLAAVTGFTVSAVAGGNLPVDTTYDVAMYAYNDAGEYGGPPTATAQATTTAANRTIRVSWNAVTGADEYRIRGKRSTRNWYPTVQGFKGDIDSPATTHDFTDEADNRLDSYGEIWRYGRDGNTMPMGFNAETAFLYVEFDGTTTLQDIKDAVDAAGYTNSCLYNASAGGGDFLLYGNLRGKSTGTGSLTVTNSVIYIIDGFIDNTNSGITIQFGSYDASSDFAYHGCRIYGGVWQTPPICLRDTCICYDCTISNYYTCGMAGYYYNALSNGPGVKNAIMNANSKHNRLYIAWRWGSPGANTEIRYAGIGYAGGTVSDLTFYSSPHYLHTAGGTYLTRIKSYAFSSSGNWEHWRILGYNPTDDYHFYDCESYLDGSLTTNNLPVLRYMGSGWTASKYFKSHSSFTQTIVDKDGNAISGAVVKLWDKDDTLVYNETTDADGVAASQYIKRHTQEMETDGTINTTYHGPFKREVTKAGYQTDLTYIDITEKTNGIIALSRPTSVSFSKRVKFN